MQSSRRCDINRSIRLRARGPGLHEITAEVEAAVAEGIAGGARPDGLVTLFLRHTSASLLIQENADPDAKVDLERWLARLVPEGDPLYTHVAEGPDDMPAHIRSALTATSLGIPLVEGRLALGTWQGIFLWEHRRRAGARELIVHLSS